MLVQIFDISITSHVNKREEFLAYLLVYNILPPSQ